MEQTMQGPAWVGLGKLIRGSMTKERRGDRPRDTSTQKNCGQAGFVYSDKRGDSNYNNFGVFGFYGTEWRGYLVLVGRVYRWADPCYKHAGGRSYSCYLFTHWPTKHKYSVNIPTWTKWRLLAIPRLTYMENLDSFFGWFGGRLV